MGLGGPGDNGRPWGQAMGGQAMGGQAMGGQAMGDSPGSSSRE